MKTFLCCLVLLSTAAPSGIGQAFPKTNQISGVWKLDLAKSKNAPEIVGIESEVITIVAQGNSYKLMFDVKQSNDYNPNYYILTDMKGGAVEPVNADGRRTMDSWRVRRRGMMSFDMELISQFGGWTDKYEVGADGKTMTLHRVPSNNGLVGEYVEKDGTIRRPPQDLTVFDRTQ